MARPSVSAGCHMPRPAAALAAERRRRQRGRDGGAAAAARRRAHARQPVQRGSARGRGQRLGRVPDPVQGLHAGLRRPPRRRSTLPCSYWRIFMSSPSRRSISRSGAERLRRRASIAVRSASWPGIASGGDRVHHVLGVALDHRHRRLHARHQRALLLGLDERGQPALAEGLDQLAPGPASTAARRRRRARCAPRRSTGSGAPCRRGGRAASRRPGTGTRASARGRRSSGGTAPASTSSSRTALRRLGATNSRRGGASPPSSETSYWPSTRCAT